MTPDPETSVVSDVETDARSQEETTQVEVEELLVEEVSIDGLCGVY